MANNRMYFVCNVCLPEGTDYDYDKWKQVSFHVAKWYPGEIGEWYTNRQRHSSIPGQDMATQLDEFFETHAHPDKYPGGVESPVRLEYEWIGTPIKDRFLTVYPSSTKVNDMVANNSDANTNLTNPQADLTKRLREVLINLRCPNHVPMDEDYELVDAAIGQILDVLKELDWHDPEVNHMHINPEQSDNDYMTASEWYAAFERELGGDKALQGISWTATEEAIIAAAKRISGGTDEQV